MALQATGAGFRSPADVFGEIFWVFLGLGTLVGIVVIGYTLYNSYKYRDGDGAAVDADVERPQVGELPRGSGGGKKLALSFSLSAIIVIGLIIWTYSTLLYIEEPPEPEMEVDVVGSQFSWQFHYPNGATTTTLHAPANETIGLDVTSSDVFHNFGIPGLRAKSDAIPGMWSETWFYAEAPGTYTAKCYELCGRGHSSMRADVVIHNQSSFEEWYASTNGSADGGMENGSSMDGGDETDGSGGGTSHSLVAPLAAGDTP